MNGGNTALKLTVEGLINAVALEGIFAETVDLDIAADGVQCLKKCRARIVALNRDLAGLILLITEDAEGVIARPFDLDAEILQCRECKVDIRSADYGGDNVKDAVAVGKRKGKRSPVVN